MQAYVASVGTVEVVAYHATSDRSGVLLARLSHTYCCWLVDADADDTTTLHAWQGWYRVDLVDARAAFDRRVASAPCYLPAA